jgi:cyclopropane fatty-acyl-phospholipid synthase-like methyltransferase
MFDVATAFDFSEHVDDEDFLHIFSAIRASLKPSGRLLLHTPNLEFFLERLKDWGVLRQFPEHIAVRSPSDHLRLLEDCGFDIQFVRIERIAHYNMLRVLHPLSRIPVLGRCFAARLFIECRA